MTADEGSGTVTVRDATAPTEPLTYSLGSSVVAVAIGDFRGQGILDIAAADSATGTVNVLRGDGLGRFSFDEVDPVGMGPKALAVADGICPGADLAVANSDSSTITVLKSRSLCGPLHPDQGMRQPEGVARALTPDVVAAANVIARPQFAMVGAGLEPGMVAAGSPSERPPVAADLDRLFATLGEPTPWPNTASRCQPKAAAEVGRRVWLDGDEAAWELLP